MAKRFIVTYKARNEIKAKDIIVIVDDEDAHLMRGSHWSIYVSRSGEIYPYRRVGFTRDVQRLSSVIMGTPEGFSVHHLNGNPCDCQRANMTLLKRGARKPTNNVK